MKTFSRVLTQVSVIVALTIGAFALGLSTLTAIAKPAAQTGSNVLYVIDGTTLSTSAGSGALTDTISSAGGGNFASAPHNPLVYTSSAITGTYNSGATQFALYLDSLAAVGNGVAARVSYDFTGDGTYDRVETYNYFPTDPVTGYELYTQAKGLVSATGTFANLSNGKVKLEIWNAIGNNTALVRTSATSANGQQSTITIPYTTGAGGPTATRTSTPVPGAGVIFYQDINYGGTASGAKAIGNYATLPADVPNDWMSSLKVPAGWVVDSYVDANFGGAVCTFTADTSWVGTACNDVMTSFKIHLPGTTTPPPTPTRTPTPGSGTPFWDTANIPVAHNVMTFKFLNRTNGKYPDSQVYWSFNGQTHSIAEQPTFDMPANSAGRMYFYLGSPTSQYNDFIEFTIGPAVFNGNTTRVDWFGVKLAMRLHAADGYDAAVGEDLTTFQEDRAVTFQKFINEVPAEFKHLAQIQAPFRIPAPGKMGETDFTPSGQYANYFASYASSVGVSASVFDIMACAGSLATNAGMCSALNRHVAQLAQSQWTNSSLFYQAAPANYYAKFWHDHSLSALAYGFPYDDYGGYSSFITHNNPQWLLVAVGW